MFISNVKDNRMKKIETINTVKIEVVSYEDTFLVSSKDVARTFGVSEGAIRNHKSRSEFVEGKHFLEGVTSCDSSTNQKMTMWTKRGIIRLGFKLQENEFTVTFRDWAEDYIISGGEVVKQKTPQERFAEALVDAQAIIAASDARNEALLSDNKFLAKEITKRDEVSAIMSNRGKGILIGDWAAILTDKDVGVIVKQKDLRQWLKANGYLKLNNLPFSTYVKNGYFTIKESSYIDSKGYEVPTYTTVINKKGMEKITPKVLDFFS